MKLTQHRSDVMWSRRRDEWRTGGVLNWLEFPQQVLRLTIQQRVAPVQTTRYKRLDDSLSSIKSRPKWPDSLSDLSELIKPRGIGVQCKIRRHGLRFIHFAISASPLAITQWTFSPHWTAAIWTETGAIHRRHLINTTIDVGMCFHNSTTHTPSITSSLSVSLYRPTIRNRSTA